MNARILPPLLLGFGLAAFLATSSAADGNATNQTAVLSTNAPVAAKEKVEKTSSGTGVTNKVSTPSVQSSSKDSARESTNGPVALTFESFRLISDRNIFNSNRSPGSRASANNEVKRAPVVESITLGGTMSYSKGSVAFFVSNSSQYRKPLKSGETLAGYTLKKVGMDRVELEKQGAGIELKVGQSLRREEGGDWKISAVVEPAAASSTSASAAAAGDSAAGGNDVLQRLLRKREKEMNP